MLPYVFSEPDNTVGQSGKPEGINCIPSLLQPQQNQSYSMGDASFHLLSHDSQAAGSSLNKPIDHVQQQHLQTQQQQQNYCQLQQQQQTHQQHHLLLDSLNTMQGSSLMSKAPLSSCAAVSTTSYAPGLQLQPATVLNISSPQSQSSTSLLSASGRQHSGLPDSGKRRRRPTNSFAGVEDASQPVKYKVLTPDKNTMLTIPAAFIVQTAGSRNYLKNMHKPRFSFCLCRSFCSGDECKHGSECDFIHCLPDKIPRFVLAEPQLVGPQLHQQQAQQSQQQSGGQEDEKASADVITSIQVHKRTLFPNINSCTWPRLPPGYSVHVRTKIEGESGSEKTEALRSEMVYMTSGGLEALRLNENKPLRLCKHYMREKCALGAGCSFIHPVFLSTTDTQASLRAQDGYRWTQLQQQQQQQPLPLQAQSFSGFSAAPATPSSAASSSLQTPQLELRMQGPPFNQSGGPGLLQQQQLQQQQQPQLSDPALQSQRVFYLQLGPSGVQQTQPPHQGGFSLYSPQQQQLPASSTNPANTSAVQYLIPQQASTGQYSEVNSSSGPQIMAQAPPLSTMFIVQSPLMPNTYLGAQNASSVGTPTLINGGAAVQYAASTAPLLQAEMLDPQILAQYQQQCGYTLPLEGSSGGLR